MLAKFYQNSVLKKPSLILVLLLICLCLFGYYSKNFRLDASSETLLIEGDPDLKYLNEINDRYGAKEFLVLTYTPKVSMIDESSIRSLLNLKKEIQELNWVHSVITLLDIPLLSSSDEPLIERLQNYSTLTTQGIDKERGFNEILNSPVFRNFVISEDGKTSGIIVYLKTKDKKTYSTLRLVVAAIKDLLIAKKLKDKQTLPDNDLISLLKKMVKQRNDSCEAYKKGGRNELFENEMSEIKIINQFLPKQLSEEETKKICLDTIKAVKANSVKDMGKVMGALKKEYSDVLDFSKVSKIIKDNLN